MSKGLPYSMSRGEKLAQEVIKETITVRGLSVDMNGVTGIGWGTAVVAGLPQGNILLLGAVFNLRITESTAGIITTFDGDVSLGSAPTADLTLSGAEVDIIPSTALTQAVASVSTSRAPSTGTENGTILDNTAGAMELNLNLLLDDASISADEAVSVDGELFIAYIMLGDD